MSKYGISEKVISLICGVFSKYPKIYEVRVFGSRAKGNYRTGSDIDLAFYADEFSFDQELILSGDLDDLNLLYKIDCIYYQKINKLELKKHIDRVSLPFYNKKDE